MYTFICYACILGKNLQFTKILEGPSHYPFSTSTPRFLLIVFIFLISHLWIVYIVLVYGFFWQNKYKIKKKYTLPQKFYNCNLVANMSQKHTLNASTHQKFTKKSPPSGGPPAGPSSNPFLPVHPKFLGKNWLSVFQNFEQGFAGF